MDWQYVWPSMSVLMTALAAGTICVMVWMSWQPLTAWKLRHLPGPPRLPFLGNLLSIAREDMTMFLDRCVHQYGPVFQIWIGMHPNVVVSDSTTARNILSSFRKRPDLKFALVGWEQDLKVVRNGMFVSNDKKWSVGRKAFESSLMWPKPLAAQVPVMMRAVWRLVHRLEGYADKGQPCDATKLLSGMTMDVIGGAAFGLDLHACDEEESLTVGAPKGAWWEKYAPGSPEFGKALVCEARTLFMRLDIPRSSWYKIAQVLLPDLEGCIRAMSRVLPDARFLDEAEARHALVQACQVLITHWKEEQKLGATSLDGKVGPGFLQYLVAHQATDTTGEMSDAFVTAQAITMVLAGYETTATTLSACVHLLTTNPEVQAKAQAEVDKVLKGKEAAQEDVDHLPYCCAVVAEALRLRPAGTTVTRRVTEEEIHMENGYVIPKRSNVLVPIYSLQHDPANWPRAEEFLPERHIQPGNEDLAPKDPRAYMPFGHGARMCVGYKFAELEARLALATLMQRLSFSPPPTSFPPPRYRTGIVYSPDCVWCTITRRSKV